MQISGRLTQRMSDVGMRLPRKPRRYSVASIFSNGKCTAERPGTGGATIESIHYTVFFIGVSSIDSRIVPFGNKVFGSN
jgi:hypothetical protein